MTADAAEKPTNGPLGIKSVEKAAVLLHSLAQSRGPLRLVDLATAAGMTRSMARAYMVSLIRADLIRQNLDTGLYDLGPGASEIGFAALARMDYLQLGKEAMLELSESIGETVIMSSWNVRGPVVVAKVDGPRSAVYEVRIGSHVSLEPTSTGHVFMTYMPRTKWQPLLGDIYGVGANRVTPMSESEIDHIIRKTQENGVAIMGASPTLPGFGGISAPVFGHEGKLLAAITVLVPAGDVEKAPQEQIITELLRVTTKLSRQLGAQR